jgi:AcrR family transcriptional regulator
MPATAEPRPHPRGRNRRGQGERLREEIIETACRMLEDLGDEQALSLRAVAREVGIATTSLYLHFADLDALVLAALESSHAALTAAIDDAETAAGPDPVARLRERTLVLGHWAHDHPGLYRVMHESPLNKRTALALARSTAAVQHCMDAGLAPQGDAVTVALDLRAAVHGAVAMRVTQPDLPWPPLDEQVERYLEKLVGVRLTRYSEQPGNGAE